MGLFGGSRRVTQTSETEVTNVSQGFENIEGPAIAGSGNVIQLTDQGALEAAGRIGDTALNVALDISAEALDTGRSALRDSAELLGRGLDNAQAAQAGAFAFGETAIEANADTAQQALNFAGDTVRGTFGFARDVNRDSLEFGSDALGRVAQAGADTLSFGRSALESSLDFAGDLVGQAIKAQADLTADNLQGLGNLAKQTSASADDRVSKVALYAFAAIAAVFVLPAIFRGAKT
jgi:hypothetical protein